MSAPYRSGSLLSFPCGCAYQVANVDGAKQRAVRCADQDCGQPDKLSACRSCSAPPIWAVSEKGRRVPIDPVPPKDGSGNLRLFRRNREFHCEQATDRHALDNYLSHFATCTESTRHRRR
jgi:hypothetical protein